MIFCVLGFVPTDVCMTSASAEIVVFLCHGEWVNVPLILS